MSNLLNNLRSPSDLTNLTAAELKQLAAELREQIITTVAATGGHLASSLGVVELTIALHHVLNSPSDKIVWDVGHQAYAHKILTGRRDNFATLRQLDGVSGFPKRCESVHDCFDVGHSSTSISAALGMAVGRDSLGGNNKIFAVIGDGSLTAGMAYEALNHTGHLDRNMVIVLNDNDMSISPNVGALSSFLSRQLTSRLFVRFKKETENFLNNVPRFGKDLIQLAKKTEESFKAFVTPGMLFEAFGIEYVGPIDGHNISELIETFTSVSRLEGPVLVHVITKKGKGYPPAEQNPSMFHGVGPFERNSGKIISASGSSSRSYTAIFGEYLCELARQDEKITAITAAMSTGTGLVEFSRRFPERFFDVGIAEQHAVTMAAGMACSGLRPVVAIYSTFLQRAYDNVLHDVCLQNLPVTFALDRGGLVGADGPTHHGVFDLSYLRPIPNITIAVPRDGVELRRAMLTAASHNGPFVYRYPRGQVEDNDNSAITPFAIGRGQRLRNGDDAAIIAIGTGVERAMQAAKQLSDTGIECSVIDARFLKPLDEELLCAAARNNANIITVEENVLAGGFGSAVMELYEQQRLYPRLLRIGLPDSFIEQGSQQQLCARYAIDADGIAAQVKDFLASA